MVIFKIFILGEFTFLAQFSFITIIIFKNFYYLVFQIFDHHFQNHHHINLFN